MNANSKWITIESLDEPVTRVARRALKGRLKWLWSRLPLAAERADEDVEHVHQLRVASRRTTAAMETFAAYLPPRRAEWFDRQLKRIRRAAGEARDLDVLAIRLQKEFEGQPADAAAAILERVVAARRAAQPEIINVYGRLQLRNFRSRLHKLIRRIRLRQACRQHACDGACCDGAGANGAPGDDAMHHAATCSGDCCQGNARSPADSSIAEEAATSHAASSHAASSYTLPSDTSIVEPATAGVLIVEPTIAEAACMQMRHLVTAWFAAADADLSDTHRLHLFRIAGKRLRYAMEIFAAALGSNCRKILYPQVVDILEHLGQINDHVSSEARLQLWLHQTDQPEQRAVLTRLLSSNAQAITAGLHAFFELWTAERRGALRAQFADELGDE